MRHVVALSVGLGKACPQMPPGWLAQGRRNPQAATMGQPSRREGDVVGWPPHRRLGMAPASSAAIRLRVAALARPRQATFEAPRL